MKFKTFGRKENPAIVLLHGGGLSWWSLRKIISLLEEEYYFVAPIIDGHGEDGETTFISIEDSARKLIGYIDEALGGKVHTICGLSIGGQIAVEVLSQRSDISTYALLESALVYPIPGTRLLTVPMYSIAYGWLKNKSFAKLQAKSLFVTEDLFDLYYQDSLKISKQSLINITLSNGEYSIKDGLKETKAKVGIVVGGKELGIMKKSARALTEAIPGSEKIEFAKYGHGELSLVHADEYVDVLKKLWMK